MEQANPQTKMEANQKQDFNVAGGARGGKKSNTFLSGHEVHKVSSPPVLHESSRPPYKLFPHFHREETGPEGP